MSLTPGGATPWPTACRAADGSTATAVCTNWHRRSWDFQRLSLQFFNRCIFLGIFLQCTTRDVLGKSMFSDIDKIPAKPIHWTLGPILVPRLLKWYSFRTYPVVRREIRSQGTWYIVNVSLGCVYIPWFTAQTIFKDSLKICHICIHSWWFNCWQMMQRAMTFKNWLMTCHNFTCSCWEPAETGLNLLRFEASSRVAKMHRKQLLYMLALSTKHPL